MKKAWIAGILALACITVVAETPSSLPQTRIKPDPNCISLTFDDGPSPIYTPQILAILKKYNIKATFFIMGGNAKLYPDMVKLIQQDGHAIASHTWTHPMLSKVSHQELVKQIQKTNDILFEITGQKPKCLRPPFGMSNKAVRDYIHSQGMHVIMWDYNSFDYERRGTQKMVEGVLKNTVHGGDILMHDGGNKREQTVEGLPLIIEAAIKRGQCFQVLCQ